jgi:hypothetical protein
MDESIWIDRAQSAEAKLKTLEDAYKPAVERVKAFKANFGVREDSSGNIEIDFEKFVEKIGPDGALELRKVIDEHYQISGKPGEKPRMRLVSG